MQQHVNPHTDHGQNTVEVCEFLMPDLALMLASTAIGPSILRGLTPQVTCSATVKALEQLGAVFSWEDGRCIVQGRGLGTLAEPTQPLFFDGYSSPALLMLGLLATQQTSAVVSSNFDGTLGPVLGPLQAMGAKIQARAGSYFPLSIQGPIDLLPIVHELVAPNALLKATILLCGLNARGVTTVIEPEITMTHQSQIAHIFSIFGAGVVEEQGADGRRRTRIFGQQTLFGCECDLRELASRN